MILALDMAAKTGWAHSDGSSGVQDFSAHEEVAIRWLAFQGWLDRIAIQHPFTLIVYEQAHHRGGPATRSACGYETVLRMFAAAEQLPLVACHTGTIKKHATGSGRASKDDMLAAAMEQHPTIKLLDDNHVDALWLLHWAESNREAV